MSAEKQAVEAASPGRYLLLNSNITTKLWTVGIRTNIRRRFSRLDSSQHQTRRLNSYMEREWKEPGWDTFEEENFIYNTQGTGCKPAEKLSVYTLFIKGAT